MLAFEITFRGPWRLYKWIVPEEMARIVKRYRASTKPNIKDHGPARDTLLAALLRACTPGEWQYVTLPDLPTHDLCALLQGENADPVEVKKRRFRAVRNLRIGDPKPMPSNLTHRTIDVFWTYTEED